MGLDAGDVVEGGFSLQERHYRHATRERKVLASRPMKFLVFLLTLPVAIGVVAAIASARGHDGAAVSDIFLAGPVLIFPLPVIFLWLRERAGTLLLSVVIALALWGIFILVGGVFAAIEEAVE